MRRASRVDVTQPEILKALRDIGASVQPLHTVGSGCPDLLIGWRGLNILLELKDGSLPPSARQLNADQKKWHGSWAGQVCMAGSIEEAVSAIIEAAKSAGAV